MSELPAGVVSAADLRKRGLALCKPDPASKSPTHKGWPTRSLEADDFGSRDLCGIIAGPLSDCNCPGHALAILDLDHPDALQRADAYLPATDMMEGKPEKPNDHRYYVVPLDSIPEWARSAAEQAAPAATRAKGHPGPHKRQFRHSQTKEVILDFLGTGGQAVCPSPANTRRWAGGRPGVPVVIPFEELWDAVEMLASVCGVLNPFRLRATATADVPARARAYVAKMPSAIEGAGGDAATWHVALALTRGFDLDVEQARPIMDEFNQRCRPPWKSTDLQRKLTDARESGHTPRGYLLGGGRPVADGEEWQQPIALTEEPGVPPPPVHVLPPPLVDFVTEVAEALNCPADFVLTALLAMASGAVGNARHLAITRSHHQSAAVYAGIIGSPGSVKSPLLKILRKPFDRVQLEYRRKWREEMEDWEKADKKDRGPRPVMVRCVVSDTTTESLCLVLAENPRGLLLIRDELYALIAGMNQYKAGGKGHDRQIYLQMWSSDTVIVDRKSDRTGEPLYVADPFVSIIGGIQPAVLGGLRGGGQRGTPPIDDGFVDRFLLAYPKELQARGETWREVSKEGMESWDAVVRKLLALTMQQEQDGLRPYFVKPTEDARPLWEEFTNSHAEELNAEGFPDHLKGVWSKMLGYCGRVALVLSCLRRACQQCGVCPPMSDEVVNVQDMRSAAQLIAYYKEHARKVFVVLNADPRTADARRVLRCLATNPGLCREGFTRRDLYQHLRRHFQSPEALDAPLRVLTEHRYLRAHLPERNGRPGPNPERYEVNPKWRDRQTRTQDPQDPQDRTPNGQSEDPGDSVYGSEGGRLDEMLEGTARDRAQDTQDL
jgi:hypothetical protein